jgi:hypothetical protein
MRDAATLSVASPPASQEVVIPGCESALSESGCRWQTARFLMQNAIDPEFKLIEPPPTSLRARPTVSPDLSRATINCDGA